MIIITSGMNFLDPSPAAQGNLALAARKNAISSALVALSEIQDPAIQAIIA